MFLSSNTCLGTCQVTGSLILSQGPLAKSEAWGVGTEPARGPAPHCKLPPGQFPAGEPVPSTTTQTPTFGPEQ